MLRFSSELWSHLPNAWVVGILHFLAAVKERSQFSCQLSAKASTPRGFLQFLAMRPPQAAHNMASYFLPGQQEHISLICHLLLIGRLLGSSSPKITFLLISHHIHRFCPHSGGGGRLIIQGMWGHLRILLTTRNFPNTLCHRATGGPECTSSLKAMVKVKPGLRLLNGIVHFHIFHILDFLMDNYSLVSCYRGK